MHYDNGYDNGPTYMSFTENHKNYGEIINCKNIFENSSLKQLELFRLLNIFFGNKDMHNLLNNKIRRVNNSNESKESEIDKILNNLFKNLFTNKIDKILNNLTIFEKGIDKYNTRSVDFHSIDRSKKRNLTEDEKKNVKRTKNKKETRIRYNYRII